MYPDIQCITMGFTTGLAVPLFLFVVSMTCDSSFGQYGVWNGPQAYAANGGSSYNNGMWYNGARGDRQAGSSASAAAYGGGNGGMAFGGTSAADGSSAGGFGTGAADAGASSGAGGFSAAAADAGGTGGSAAGNGIGGFSYSSAGTGDRGFVGGAAGNGATGFGPAPLGNVLGGFGPAPLGKVLPGFGGDQGSASAAAAGSGPVGYDGGADGVAPTANAVGGRRNGAWKSGRGRPRKLIKPTILSGGFSLSKILPYVKNVFTGSYFKLSLPESQKRTAKCSGLFQSAGFSFDSMYQAYIALYNDISATHGEMSFFEVGTLAFMEIVFGIVKFLKLTPFACMLDVAKTFDYISLMYCLLGLMGCDDVCVAKWLTYAYSAFS